MGTSPCEMDSGAVVEHRIVEVPDRLKRYAKRVAWTAFSPTKDDSALLAGLRDTTQMTNGSES
jgi:hypothetical protein